MIVQITPYAICFNPRPSCEGRRRNRESSSRGTRFNPRPSCEGRQHANHSSTKQSSFNPRPSCEGRLVTRLKLRRHLMFQSTPLLRGATLLACCLPFSVQFQSTPLLRGATKPCQLKCQAFFVSIHAPLARGDASGSTGSQTSMCLNPRPSCEGRQGIG